MAPVGKCAIASEGILTCQDLDPDREWTCSAVLKERALFTDSTKRIAFLPFDPCDDLIATFVPRTESRYMGHQFRFGAAAAGLALQRGDVTTLPDCTDTALSVATRVAERDEAIDADLLTVAGDATEREDVSARLMRTFRPNMFLAQLPNLLASNLSIVFGLRGTSRTYIGEQMAGANALFEGVAQIERGACSRVLAGGSVNADRESLLRWIDGVGMGESHASSTSAWCPSRTAHQLGSSAAFILLESERSASKRAIAPLADLRTYGRVRGAFGSAAVDRLVTSSLHDVLERNAGRTIVLSNAGGGRLSQLESHFWAQTSVLPVISSADILGTALEADAPSQVALAVRMLGRAPSMLRQIKVIGTTLPATVAAVIVITSGLFGDVAVCSVEARR